MEHRIKRDETILNLVSDFEKKLSVGDVGYLSEKSFNAIISYYESESLLVQAIEVIDLAVNQFPFRSDFLISKARVLLNMHMPEKAIKIIEQTKKIAPFEFEVQILEAKAYTILEDFLNARTILDQLKGNSSKEDQVEILLVEAKINELNKSFDNMYDCLTEAVLLDTNNPKLYEELWLAIELSRNYIQCIEFHKSIINEKPYSFMAWNNLGHAYAYEGEYEKAIFAFEYSFIINKHFESGYMDAADLCIQIKDYKRALKILLDANEVFGNDSDTLLLISSCYIQLANYKKAKYFLFKAIKTDPYSDEIYFNLGICYFKEEEWQNAVHAFHKAITLEDSIEDYYSYLGRAYYQLGSFDKAGQFFSKATTIAPEESAYWSEYASFLIKQGQYELALNLVDEAEEFTFGADILFCGAVAYYKMGHFKKAFRVFEEALAEDYFQHKIIFDIDPELSLDEELTAMISYYKMENEA